MGWKRKQLEALADEDLHDVHLVGKDGKEVGCTKARLAATSPVFKSMFFKGFREQSASRCELKFHSVVIGIVVKYCYCGELDIWKPISEYSSDIPPRAELLTEAREAGRYFELEELRLTAEKIIGIRVFNHTSGHEFGCVYACAFLTELFNRGEDDGPFWNVLFEFAVEHAELCFGNPRHYCHHSNGLVLIKVLEKIDDTFVIAKCLQNWFEKNCSRICPLEKEALANFSKTVDLKKLSTIKLSLLFKKKSYDVFPSEKIVEAFCHSVQGQETPSPKPKGRRFYVSGAGMEDFNGFYDKMRHSGSKKRKYCKSGGYGDQECLFMIHYKSKQKKWMLSITNGEVNDEIDSDEYGDVDNKCIALDAYEVESPSGVPFTGWNCLEGAGPAPLVAPINP